jgi:hypothetical protein
MRRQGYDLQLTQYDERGDFPHDRDGTFADERDRNWVGTDAVAGRVAGGVGGVEAPRDSGRR